MKLFYIGAGLVFLIDPIFGIHDYLPDFIGCFLIMLGIRDAAYMIEKLENSRRWFMYGSWISIIRFAISFTNVESQHTLPLTLAFVFAIVELIIYIPAFRNLFSGIDYAAMRHGGSGVLSIGRKMGYYTDESGLRQYGEIQEDTTGRIALFSQIFMVIRAISSLLPELPALQLSESENFGEVGGFQFSSIGNLINLTTAIITLIPGILLFIYYMRFFRRIKKSGDFIPIINAELERRFGDLNELHICSQMKTVSLIAGAALFLYMGFYDYQINIIIRAIPAGILCIAALVLFFASGKKIVCLLPVIPALATIPISLQTRTLQNDRYKLYRLQMRSLYSSGEEYVYDRNINRVDDAYVKMATSECLEAVVFGAAIIIFLIIYLKLCLKHTDSFRSVPTVDRADINKSLRIRGGLMIGTAVLSVIAFTAYRVILPYFDSALMLCVGINVLAFAMYAVFASQVNERIYGNLHGVL